MSAAVITGAASGLGLALAHRCAELGMDVALLDRDGDRAVDEASRLAAEVGTRIVGLRADVGDPASLDAAARAVGDRFGQVELLISNVGVQLFGSVETFTDDEWNWLLDINVTGSARVVRTFLPLLRAAGRSHLAFTTSSSILDPANRLGAYQASKFAVWGLAETLRLELADDNVGVTVILPSGLMSRHLETSEAAQPEHLRRPIANDGDFDAMIASNAEMASMLAEPGDAAVGIIEAVLAGERYVITHGDLTAAVEERSSELTRAAFDAKHRHRH